jgi:V/A-type H+/Na+-transporting ATPase subunit D
MRTPNNPPTRQELLLLKKRVSTAERGKTLLKDKRDSLIRMFLLVIKETIALQKDVHTAYRELLDSYRIAEARMSPEYTAVLAKTTKAAINLQTTYATQMGVNLPTVEAQLSKTVFDYSVLHTNPDFDETMNRLREFIPLLVSLLEKEQQARLLAFEIESTRRRVNALDYVVIPELKYAAKVVYQKLEEQARSATVALMKLKQVMSAVEAA